MEIFYNDLVLVSAMYIQTYRIKEALPTQPGNLLRVGQDAAAARESRLLVCLIEVYRFHHDYYDKMALEVIERQGGGGGGGREWENHQEAILDTYQEPSPSPPISVNIVRSRTI